MAEIRRIKALRWATSMSERRGLRFLRAALCVAVVWAIVAPAFAAVGADVDIEKMRKKQYDAAGTPTKAIQDLDDMLDNFKVAPKGGTLSAADEEYNRKIKEDIIHGTFDIRELSMQSLATHWKERTPQEQDQFVQLLTNLLEEKALFSKEQSAAKSKSGGKYYVVYKGHKFYDPEQKRAFVRTKVVVPSEKIDIALNYRLKKKGEEWKIYDVIVDEASLVDNYRYQFDSIIKKHGYQDLVRRMNEKLDQIRSKRKS